MTPAVPADATAISIGLNLFANGTLTTDDYELYDKAGVKTFSDIPLDLPLLQRDQLAIQQPHHHRGMRMARSSPGSSTADDGSLPLPAGGQPGCTGHAPTFTDVAPSNQFYNEIRWLASRGISHWFPDGTYRPCEPVNRDAWRRSFTAYNGSPAVPGTAPTFPDVTSGNQFYNEIRWLGATGNHLGYPDGTFSPVQPINRDAMAAFVYRYNLNFPKGM